MVTVWSAHFHPTQPFIWHYGTHRMASRYRERCCSASASTPSCWSGEAAAAAPALKARRWWSGLCHPPTGAAAAAAAAAPLLSICWIGGAFG